jgi:prepilin-type processing-associated H-X9-DG protein
VEFVKSAYDTNGDGVLSMSEIAAGNPALVARSGWGNAISPVVMTDGTASTITNTEFQNFLKELHLEDRDEAGLAASVPLNQITGIAGAFLGTYEGLSDLTTRYSTLAGVSLTTAASLRQNLQDAQAAERRGDRAAWYAYRSQHIGGVNVVFADGPVRVLGETLQVQAMGLGYGSGVNAITDF